MKNQPNINKIIKLVSKKKKKKFIIHHNIISNKMFTFHLSNRENWKKQ